MKSTWRLIVMMTFLSLTCTGAAFLALRAVAQSGSAPAPAAQTEGEIEDDPVIAPDPEESADNNITYPVDI